MAGREPVGRGRPGRTPSGRVKAHGCTRRRGRAGSVPPVWRAASSLDMVKPPLWRTRAFARDNESGAGEVAVGHPSGSPDRP